MKKLITLAFCIFYLSSCTANHGHFTVITNKMLDKSHFKIADQQVGKNVRGRSVTHIILSWELGDSDISEALDRAMKQDIGSDMLVNADMLYWAWFVPGFYGQHGWRIRGNANSSIMPLEPTQIVEE